MRRLLSCTRYRKAYSAFRDGALAPEAADDVRVHLDGCEPCRRRHHALEFGVRLLRALDRDQTERPLLHDQFRR